MGLDDPETLKFLAEEMLGRCMRKEKIEGSPWWKFWGDRIKARYQSVPRWLMDSQQCREFLDPTTGQIIVTRFGRSPMRLKRLSWWIELPVWKYEVSKTFGESVTRSAFRSIWSLFNRRAEEKQAFREFVNDRKAATQTQPEPPRPSPMPEMPEPSQATFADAEPEPEAAAPVIETPKPKKQRTRKPKPVDVKKVFDREFHPEFGRFRNADLRRRIYQSVNPESREADMHGSLWAALLKPDFTEEERNEVFKHYMAVVAAEKVLNV